MKPDLRALLAQWKETLRLLDWQIEISYVRDLVHPANKAPVYALCHPFVDAKRARIAIRDPETPLTSNDPPIEERLIHELLHLHFAPFGGETSAEIAAEEQAVWAITEAMTGLKGTGQGAMLARAMGALAGGMTTTRRTRVRSRRNEMDWMLFMAALKAALAAEDPKATIEALVAEVEKANAAGAAPAVPAADPMAAGADPAAPKPEEPKPPVALAAPAARAQAASIGDAVSRAEFDTFRVEQLLGKRGHLLDERQRAWAATQPFVTVEQLLANTTEKPAPDASSAPRRAAPTTGGSRGMRAENPEFAEVDRRMGVGVDDSSAVTIDPLTNKLSISSLRPVKVQTMGGGK